MSGEQGVVRNSCEAPEFARFAVELRIQMGFYHLHNEYPEENFYDDPSLLPDWAAFHASLDEAAIFKADAKVDRKTPIAGLAMPKRMTTPPSAGERLTRSLRGAFLSVTRRLLPLVR